MAEWIRNVFIKPFINVFDGIGPVIAKVATIIINQYGKRLLKMDTDKIIRECICQDNHNILYLYPLHMKEIELKFALNLLRISEGIINNPIIIIPWGNLLSESTVINISDIYLQIFFSRNIENICPVKIESVNTSFFSDDTEEKQSILDIYSEIYEHLVQFCSRVKFKIDFIKIMIVDYLEVILNNVLLDNCEFFVENVEIRSLSNGKLIDITPIKYQWESKCLNFGVIEIDNSIITNIPELYLSPSEKSYDINIVIDRFIMKELDARNIEITINQNILNVKQIECLCISDVTHISFTRYLDKNNILSFDCSSWEITFQSCLNFELSNLPKLLLWGKKINNILKMVFSKIIILDSNDKDKHKKIMVNSLEIRLIYGDNDMFVKIGNLYIKKKNKMSDITIKNNKIISELVVARTGKKYRSQMCDISIGTSEFTSTFDIIKIVKNGQDLNVEISGGNASDILQIIDLLSNIIKRNHTNDTNLMEMGYFSRIRIIIFEYRIGFSHKQNNFVVLLKNANIHYHKDNNNISASFRISILINEYLVAKASIEYISKGKIVINKLRIFLDPDIFDKVCYLCGILNMEPLRSEEIFYRHVPPEGLEQLQVALSRSIIVENISQLEHHIDETIGTIAYNSDAPNIKFLITSINDLRKLIIDDYISRSKELHFDIELRIVSSHIYMYDKLNKVDKNKKKSFLCIILKDIYFTKSSEQVPRNDNNNIVKVIEYGNHCLDTKYNYILKIKNGAIMDITCQQLEWKYLVKFTNNMLNVHISMYHNSLRVNITFGQFMANIREETLVRLLAFFSCNHCLPSGSKRLHVEYLEIGAINGIVNYYPIILNSIGMCRESFTIKNFRLYLKPQSIRYVENLDHAVRKIIDKWKEEVNPNNMFQFIPNIKIIQPYATPMVYLISLITQYFKHPSNRKKIHSITKNINNRAYLVAKLIKSGIHYVWDLFEIDY
jgi:hypothetical protein